MLKRNKKTETKNYFHELCFRHVFIIFILKEYAGVCEYTTNHNSVEPNLDIRREGGFHITQVGFRI